MPVLVDADKDKGKQNHLSASLGSPIGKGSFSSRSSSPGWPVSLTGTRTVIPHQGDTGNRDAGQERDRDGPLLRVVPCSMSDAGTACRRSRWPATPPLGCGAASTTTTPRSRPRAGPASQAGLAGRVGSAPGPDTDLPHTGYARPGEVRRLTAPSLRPGGRADARQRVSSAAGCVLPVEPLVAAHEQVHAGHPPRRGRPPVRVRSVDTGQTQHVRAFLRPEPWRRTRGGVLPGSRHSHAAAAA
jgi:hypothetical protein